jgi:hypothetical protein
VRESAKANESGGTGKERSDDNDVTGDADMTSERGKGDRARMEGEAKRSDFGAV